jgi:hypothetical protein
MTAERFRVLIGAGGIAALAAAALALGGGGASPASAADPSVAAQAEALREAQLPSQAASVAHDPGPDAARRAAELAGQVPLPPGEAFDDIVWDNGELSDLDIQGLLEMNAACKWWLANADHPTGQTARVVAAIPDWPTMREGDRHVLTTTMAAPDGSALAAQFLAQCRRELG